MQPLSPTEVIKLVKDKPLTDVKDLLFKEGVNYHIEFEDGQEFGFPVKGWIGAVLTVEKGRVVEASFQLP